MKTSRLPRAIVTAIVTFAVTIIPVAAQVGHNPFQATPIAGGTSGWQVTGVTPLEIDGMAVALSPDGATIAGLGADGQPCFWTVADLEQTCADLSSDGPPLRIDPDSIAWAPDSSAVAFSVPAYVYAIDGDIYVLEREDAALLNVTDDDIDEFSFINAEAGPTPIDVMPAWTPDSASIVFSRTVWDDRDELSNEIMSVHRDGGDPETLLSLPGLPASIYLPMRVLADGSILYTVGFSDVSEPTNGLWRLSPQGEAIQLMPGASDSAFPIPTINDVWEGEGEIRVIGHSPVLAAQFDLGTPFAFVWSSINDAAEPLEPVTAGPGILVHAGAISPDGRTLLSLQRSPGDLPMVVLQGPGVSAIELPEFDAGTGPGRLRYLTASWSSANLVLVSPLLTAGAYLLAVEPVPASGAMQPRAAL